MQTLKVELIALGETRDEDTKRSVYADVDSVSREEFASSGAAGMQARKKALVWAEEYRDEEEIVISGKRLAIYRTYGPTAAGKIELYAGERVGVNEH